MLDGVTAIEGEHKPNEGDYTICVYCTSFLKFTADMSYKELTEQEIAEMDDDNKAMLVHARNMCESFK